MFGVEIGGRYQEIPDLGLMMLRVKALPNYTDDVARIRFETQITAAARSYCNFAESWREVPFINEYGTFYRSMGLNVAKISTPCRQAFRYTSKDYHSVSHLVDRAMYAEYSTGVSFQVFSSQSLAGPIMFRETQEGDGYINSGGEWQRPRAGELGLFCSNKLIHAPSIGIAPVTHLNPDDTEAIVRIMKVPGVPDELWHTAIDLFINAPTGQTMKVTNRWMHRK